MAKFIRVTLSLDKATKKSLEELYKLTGLSMSMIVRQAVELIRLNIKKPNAL